jgi:uncharacterized protein (TIGR00255 family)
MIRSMTGYGRGEKRAGGLRASVEVRSVNHRFLDLKLRLPQEAGRLEFDLRRCVGRRLERGRVDMAVTLERENGAGSVQVDRDLIRGYLRAAREIREETGVPGEVRLETLVQLPGALRLEAARADLTRDEAAAVVGATEAALAALVAMRNREGSALARDLRRRIGAIRRRARAIRRRAAGLPRRQAERLRRRVRQLSGGMAIDPARLAQEVAILADRADVQEEVVRLLAHLDAMADLLSRDGGPSGKELDFLAQELHRETNTIHAKVGDLPITRAALEIKSEVEKIREQVQNVE